MLAVGEPPFATLWSIDPEVGFLFSQAAAPSDLGFDPVKCRIKYGFGLSGFCTIPCHKRVQAHSQAVPLTTEFPIEGSLVHHRSIPLWESQLRTREEHPALVSECPEFTPSSGKKPIIETRQMSGNVVENAQEQMPRCFGVRAIDTVQPAAEAHCTVTDAPFEDIEH
jgi:hypothetical protein